MQVGTQMRRSDSFVELLETNPGIVQWLEEQADVEVSRAKQFGRCVVERNSCATGEFSRPLFKVSVNNCTGQLPTDNRIHQLFDNMRITKTNAPAPKPAKHLVPSPAVESASGFYAIMEELDDGWGLGVSVGTDARPMGLAMLMGYEPCEGLGIRATRILTCKRTGEVFEIMLLRDGRALVLHNSRMTTRYSVRMYAPRQPSGRWGHVLRSTTMTSMMDCVSCCSREKIKSHGLNAQSSFCRCAEPTLPLLARPFETWSDFLQMHADRVQDTLQLQRVFDESSKLIGSFVLYQPQSIARTTPDALHLFQALVLNTDRLHASPQPRPFAAFSSLCSSSSSRAALLNSPTSSAQEGATDADIASLENKTVSQMQTIEAFLPPPETATSTTPLDSDGRTGAAPVECEICKKRFTRWFHARRHMVMVHSEVRNHPCSECGAQFKLKSHLKAHIEHVHLDGRSQPCPHCSKQFASASNLTRHIDGAHLKQRSFSCTHCSKEYHSKYNLDRHMRNSHQNSI